MRDLGYLVDRFKRCGVSFASITEQVDTGTAVGALFLNVIASLSQWEREVIGERTAAALGHLKSKGKRISGWAPFGYKFQGDQVIPYPSERRVLERIKELRRGGFTLAEISVRLAKNGHTTRNGRPFAVTALSFMARGIERRSREAGNTAAQPR